MHEILVVGSRGSKLAMIQSEWVVDRIKAFHPGLIVRIEVISTAGDKIQSAPFAQVGALGIFVREIESALADKRIDLAVHSLKDLQTDLHPDLMIGAIPERESARDVLVSRSGAGLDTLPPDAVIGTSSARRRGLLACEKRGFTIKECRGNLTTRLTKLESGEFDAILLAEAGLKRMGLADKITENLDVHRFVPAVGQGAIGIEIRRDDARVADIVRPINHELSFAACTEERIYLAEIGGGCHAPIGGHMHYINDKVEFIAYMGTCDGKWYAREQIYVDPGNIVGTGRLMANRMRSFPGSELFFKEVIGDAC
jgi:hydroxymethylbilane synthase